MDTVDRKKREMDLIVEKEKKILILSKYLHKQDLLVKDLPNRTVKLKEYSKDGSRIIIQTDGEIPLNQGEIVVLSKLLARYVQLDCTVLRLRPFNHFELEISELYVAKRERVDKRIQPPKDHVWITNIRTSRASLDTNNFSTIPTYVKINFSDYESKLRSKFDYIKIDVFNPGLDEKFYIVRNTGKTLYIENTQKEECYESQDDDYVNYLEELVGDVHKAMSNYRNQKVISEIIMPVIYLSPSHETSTIGYVHIKSRTKPISFDQLMETKVLTFEMIDRIRESNTLTNTKRFPIIDMSAGGVRVLINDSELIDQLPHQLGFTFDIYYKLQSPMTMYGVIRYTAKDKKGNLILGLSISGSSNSSEDRKRYLINLDSLQNNPDLHILESN
jgi:hypothetical protein